MLTRAEIDALRDETGALHKAAVKCILPYEDEFLFVDSVSSLTDKEVLTLYKVPLLPLVKANYVHAPVMPNVLLSEVLTQAGMLLLFYSCEFEEETDIVVVAMRKALLKSPVVAGESVQGRVCIVNSNELGAHLKSEMFVGEREVYSMHFDVRFFNRPKLTKYVEQLKGASGLFSLEKITSVETRFQTPEDLSSTNPPLEGNTSHSNEVQPIERPAIPPVEVSSQPPKRGKGRVVGWLALLAAVASVVAGFQVYDQKPRALIPVAVERADLENVIRVTGEVINDRTVSLTALVDGQVRQIHVNRGARVKADEVLASMDNRAAAARKQRSSAVVNQEEVKLREQRQRRDRVRKLASKKLVSEEELEQVELQVQAARAAWEVARAEAQVIAVEQDWQKLRAPFDAVVVEKSTEAGQWVEAGTEMFQLVALEGWEIEAHLDSIDSGRVSVGQAVSLSSESFPDKSWEANISWIGPMVERETERHLNTFPVRMKLGDGAPELLLGQQLDVEISLEQRARVLSLPFTALREKESGGFEVALLEQGKVIYQSVETGLETDTRVEISNGLEEGKLVIRLDGERVEVGTSAYFDENNDSD